MRADGAAAADLVRAAVLGLLPADQRQEVRFGAPEARADSHRIRVQCPEALPLDALLRSLRGCKVYALEGCLEVYVPASSTRRDRQGADRLPIRALAAAVAWSAAAVAASAALVALARA